METYFRENEYADFELLFDSEEEALAHVEEYKASIVEEGDTVYESIDITIQPQISMVVMDQATGYVKGIVGGPRREDGQSFSEQGHRHQPSAGFHVQDRIHLCAGA